MPEIEAHEGGAAVEERDRDEDVSRDPMPVRQQPAPFRVNELLEGNRSDQRDAAPFGTTFSRKMPMSVRTSPRLAVSQCGAMVV